MARRRGISSRLRGRAFCLVVAALLVGACGEEKPAPSPAPREPEPAAPARIGPYEADRFYIEVDRFLAATDPRVVEVDKATFLKADDEVFGIVVEEQARAYAITHLSYHHVVNDVVAGIPVAVTY